MKYIYITDEGIFKSNLLKFPNWETTVFIIDTVSQEYLNAENWAEENSLPEWKPINEHT